MGPPSNESQSLGLSGGNLSVAALDIPLLVSWWMVPSEEPLKAELGISGGSAGSPVVD